MKKETKVISYKGFNVDEKGMYCHPNGGNRVDYKVGKSYKTDKADCCKTGFHACPMPLAVFGYYEPSNSKYALVEQSGTLDKEDDKIASTKITIKGELNIFDLVKAQIEWVRNQLDPDKEAASNTGDYSAASNTGYQSAASNTGNRSAASNTGDYSAASNTGNRSAASNTGNRSAASNTGDYSAASNTGYQSAASNTGNRSAASNTGNRSAASNTGDYSAASNTGNRSAASNTGDYSAASNTGNRSAASVEGASSVAFAMGYQSRAKACKDSCIVICDWAQDKNDKYFIKEIYSAKIGGKILDTKIEPNTWYWLENGELKSEKE